MDIDYLKVRARFDGDRIAVIDPNKNRKWTYQDLHQRAIHLALYLRERGVEKGDRVALFAPNDIAYLDLLYACGKLGAIMVPLNWRLKPNEIKVIFEDCQPTAVLYACNHMERLGLVPQDLLWLDIDSEDYERICSNPEKIDFTAEKVDKASPAFLIYTSGTTGMPKGVIITHNGTIHNSLNALVAWSICKEHITLASAPMFHIAGFAATVLPFIMIGAQVVIHRYFDSDSALNLIEKYKITHLFLVPTMYYGMVVSDKFSVRLFESTQACISGGAPPSQLVAAAFEEIGHTIINSYGLSEVGPHNFRILKEEVSAHPGSIGKPIQFVSAKIVNEKREEVEPGEVGELLISGEHVCGGYWENSTETQKAFYGKYFCTGDLARQDEEGFYYIVNRKKELIITGGENVLPSEVEAVLDRHPLVKESIVVGYNHPEYGESVSAMIRLEAPEESADFKQELHDYCLRHLAGYKTPKYYMVIKDFPKTSIGKIDRLKIKKMIESEVYSGLKVAQI